MSLLLNWRVWVAIALAAAFAATGWKAYIFGAESVQVTFDAYKNQQILNAFEQEKIVKVKEIALNESNQKVNQNYESLKTATATAVLSLDADRMRLSKVIASNRSSTNQNTGTGLKPDASTEDIVLGGCISRYETVAGDAQSLSNQVISLQNYINNVVKP